MTAADHRICSSELRKFSMLTCGAASAFLRPNSHTSRMLYENRKTASRMADMRAVAIVACSTQ
jgi:hypothetical protein